MKFNFQKLYLIPFQKVNWSKLQRNPKIKNKKIKAGLHIWSPPITNIYIEIR